MEKVEVRKVHEDSRGKIYSIKLNAQEARARAKA